jgi:hypothetical protein
MELDMPDLHILRRPSTLPLLGPRLGGMFRVWGSAWEKWLRQAFCPLLFVPALIERGTCFIGSD